MTSHTKIGFSDDGEMIAIFRRKNNRYNISLVNRFLNSTSHIIRNVARPINVVLLLYNKLEIEIYYSSNSQNYFFFQIDNK